MAFDALTVLRGKYGDSYVNLETSEVVAVALAANSDGACVVDLKKTGKKGLAAVLVCPTRAALDYEDTLTVTIEESDHLDRGWETVMAFPVIYAFLMKLKVKCTTAYIPSDIGKAAVEATSLDAGLLVSYGAELEAADGIGYIVVRQDDVDSLFNNTDAAISTTGGTGAATEVGVAEKGFIPDGGSDYEPGTPGTYVRRFTSNKRYIRGKYVASATSNFGKVQCLIGDDQLDRL